MSTEEESMEESQVAYQVSDRASVLEGIQYLVNESGVRTAVVISLKEWGELWEDFCDVLVSESRRGEPSIPWETLKA